MGIKEKIEASPNASGVYILKDNKGMVIYVGKAVSIRKRLRSHFARDPSPKQRALIENVADLDYLLTPDESTALLLEAALIKKYDPKYNIALRDDKSYPRLKLTINEEYPRLFITRRLKDDGALYFGPYTNAKLLREAVEFMRRTFPLRTCQRIPKKICLNFHIGQCLGPCVDRGRKREYNMIIEELKLFLDGKQDELLESLASRMKEVSESKDYEKAARIRDRIKALSSVRQSGSQLSPMPTGLLKAVSIKPSQQMEELCSLLKLTKMPRIIEAFDVSNISGKEAVGSVVSFKDGKPNREEYRRFKIKTVRVIDDYSMMREIVLRRYSRLLREDGILPDLIIVDGGKGHLIAAKRQLFKLKLLNIPVIGIAKRPDKIYISEKKDPILLGKFEGVLLLVQRIRDEAHRSAIDYHRLLRRKQLGVSELDDIKGIGAKRKVELIRYFGSLNKIKMADIEDLKKVEFINEKEAKAIYNHFH